MKKVRTRDNRDNQVNRNIDAETAEGHVKLPRLEDVTEDGKRAAAKRAAALDDVAEGHRRATP